MSDKQNKDKFELQLPSVYDLSNSHMKHFHGYYHHLHASDSLEPHHHHLGAALALALFLGFSPIEGHALPSGGEVKSRY